MYCTVVRLILAVMFDIMERTNENSKEYAYKLQLK